MGFTGMSHHPPSLLCYFKAMVVGARGFCGYRRKQERATHLASPKRGRVFLKIWERRCREEMAILFPPVRLLLPYQAHPVGATLFFFMP
jgi:hypothetical protein